MQPSSVAERPTGPQAKLIGRGVRLLLKTGTRVIESKLVQKNERFTFTCLSV